MRPLDIEVRLAIGRGDHTWVALGTSISAELNGWHTIAELLRVGGKDSQDIGEDISHIENADAVIRRCAVVRGEYGVFVIEGIEIGGREGRPLPPDQT